MKILDFLKNKVAEAGTQTAVARKTGVSQGTITKIINEDTKPELSTIRKIAEAYGIPLTEFEEIAPYPHGTKKYQEFAAATASKSKEDHATYGAGKPHKGLTPDDEYLLNVVGDNLTIRLTALGMSQLSEEDQAIIHQMVRDAQKKGRAPKPAAPQTVSASDKAPRDR